MPNAENNESKTILGAEYKTVAKNTILSILNSYGFFILSLITSFFLARMISQEDWGLLILAISLIGIFSTISNFIPPGLIFSMNFYIPRYRAKNDTKKLRSFIAKALYFKIFSVIVFFFIALIIFVVFRMFFSDYFENHLNLLFILLPLIIITNLETFIVTVLMGFNMFKFNLVFLSIKSVVNIIPLLWYFFTTRVIEIETVALINIVSALIPLFVEIIIFWMKFPKKVSNSERGLTMKRFLQKVIKYGSFLRIHSLLGDVWKEGQTQSIRIYEDTEWVTGYSISKSYTRVSGIFLSSLTTPLLYSFSSLDYKDDYNKIVALYKSIFTYSLYIYIVVTGLLFILSDFFLGFIYGPDYQYYSILIQLILLGNVVSIYGSLFFILLRTTNRIKLLIIITIIGYPYQIILFLVSLIFFGIEGMLFIDIISRLIWSGIYYILSIKILKVNINISKVLILYSTFFFSLFLSIFLGNLIFNDLSSLIWQSINLSIFEKLNIGNILVFLVSFLSLNVIFKTFTKEDIGKIELLFTKDTSSHKFIRKTFRFLKRFLR